MRKILVFITFILSLNFCFGGTIDTLPIVPRSNGSIYIQDYRFFPKYNLNLPVYPDTTTANNSTYLANDYCGAMIYSSSNDIIYWRSCSPSKHWAQFASGGGSSSIVNIYNNSIVSYHLINGDSCVVPTLGSGVFADTVCFNFVVCKVDFQNDSTLIACPCDTTVALCSTAHFTKTPLYVFQNGLMQPFPGIVEQGGNFQHNTYINLNNNDFAYKVANDVTKILGASNAGVYVAPLLEIRNSNNYVYYQGITDGGGAYAYVKIPSAPGSSNPTSTKSFNIIQLEDSPAATFKTRITYGQQNYANTVTRDMAYTEAEFTNTGVGTEAVNYNINTLRSGLSTLQMSLLSTGRARLPFYDSSAVNDGVLTKVLGTDVNGNVLLGTVSGGVTGANNGLVANSSGVVGLDSNGVNPLSRNVIINARNHDFEMDSIRHFTLSDINDIAFTSRNGTAGVDPPVTNTYWILDHSIISAVIRNIGTTQSAEITVDSTVEAGYGMQARLSASASGSGNVNELHNTPYAMRWRLGKGRWVVDSLNQTTDSSRFQLMLKNRDNDSVKTYSIQSLLSNVSVNANNGLVKDAAGFIGLDSNSVNPLTRNVRISAHNHYFVMDTLSALNFQAGVGQNQGDWNMDSTYYSIAMTKGGNMLSSEVIRPDSISFLPNLGKINIDSLRSGTSNDDIMTWNGGMVRRIPSSTFLTGITSDNGLTANTATNVQLGGTLINATTTVDGGANVINWTFNSLAGANGFRVGSTSTAASGSAQNLFVSSLSGANANSSQTTTAGFFNNSHTGTSPTNRSIFANVSGGATNYAIYASSSGAASSTNYGLFTTLTTTTAAFNYGVLSQVSAVGSGANYGGFFIADGGTINYAIVGQTNNSSTNTVTTNTRFERNVSGGVGADGVGLSLDFYNETDGASSQLSNQIISKWPTAADATRTSQLSFTGVNSAVTTTLGTWDGNANLIVGTTNSIVGTVTNNDAVAGNIGEEIASSGLSTYTNYTTTATYQAIDSITLTAGDWDISALGTFNSNTATITEASNAIFVISTTIASASGATEGKNIVYIPQAALIGTSKESVSITSFRVSLSGSTKYYLNSQATFTLGNPQFVGSIRARRMR